MTSEEYHTVSHAHNGEQYQFRFYKGFVRRLLFVPPGSTTPVVLYTQTERFDTRPSGGPRASCALHISKSSGADPFEVELAVDASPLDSNYKGRISRFEVDLQPSGTTHRGTQRVKPSRGGERVRDIRVTEKNGGGAGGGVHAMQTSGGGTIIVEDDAETCPPDCT